MLLPDDTTDVHARNKGNLQVSPDMLNTLLTLKVTDSSILDSPDSIKVNAMGGMSGFDTTSERHLYNKRKQFIQKVMNGIKKHMSNWLHSLPEKLPGKENKKETIPKEMKAINNKDYILDTYDQTGQYKQMRKTTLIKDTVNKKV